MIWARVFPERREIRLKPQEDDGGPIITLADFNEEEGWLSDTGRKSGSFGAAIVIVQAWTATGTMFHYSDAWQELIRAMLTARNTMIDLENCTEEEIAAMCEEFANIRARVQQ